MERISTDLPPPSKLFRVQRISGLKYRNYWERKIFNDLGLLYWVSCDLLKDMENEFSVHKCDSIPNKSTFILLFRQIKGIAVVKNTPEMCALLWRVKHLVSVEPITFPYGEPTEQDINYTNLKENGECIVHKQLEIPAERIEATDKFLNDPLRLDKDTLKKDALAHWVSGR